jgi:micrococcal nuclease
VDGDTVVLSGPDGPVTVRLIGVDTPETVHPNKPVERFGREASAFLKTLIGGKLVRVEYEPGSPRLDRYGRTLAYLYLEPGGLFVNREIVARGYGHAYTKYPFTFLEDFRAAERVARERRLGLWGPERAGGTPVDDGTVFITRTGTKYHRAGCRYVAADAAALPLEQAAARYGPCSVCRPPVPEPRRRDDGPIGDMHHRGRSASGVVSGVLRLRFQVEFPAHLIEADASTVGIVAFRSAKVPYFRGAKGDYGDVARFIPSYPSADRVAHRRAG